MKEFVRFVARGLVDNPEAVEVVDGGEDEDGRRVIELRVDAEDRGKVIGKKGRMAHNIRTLLAAASGEGSATTLEIVD